jgi:spore germination cell wall hydrolase CwlJ-like protein
MQRRRASWRSPLLWAAVAAFLLLLLALAVALRTISLDEAAPGRAGMAAATQAAPGGVDIRPPAVEPMLLRPLAPTDAVAINAAIPLASSPGPAARPLLLSAAAASYGNALDCLTAALYYEAATESLDGQRAVAQVVLNRVRHPAFPSSVCGVVFEGSERATGCQFTFTCDGSLLRRPVPQLWARLREVARSALSGSVFAKVGNATHYHADYVVPYWASSLRKSAVIGRHIFYRWQGHWGLPAAFRQPYRAAEPSFAALVDSKLASAQPLSTPPVPEELAALLSPPAPEEEPEQPQVQEDRKPRSRLLADELAGALLIGGDDPADAGRDTRKAAPSREDCAAGAARARPAQPVGPSSGLSGAAATC